MNIEENNKTYILDGYLTSGIVDEILQNNGYNWWPANKCWIKKQFMKKPLIAETYYIQGHNSTSFFNHHWFVEVGEGEISNIIIEILKRDNTRKLKNDELMKTLLHHDMCDVTFVREVTEGDCKVDKYFAIRFDEHNKKFTLADVTHYYNPKWSNEYYECIKNRCYNWGIPSENFFKNLKADGWQMIPAWPEEDDHGHADLYIGGGDPNSTIKLKRENRIMTISPGGWSLHDGWFKPQIKKVKS